jgi:type IV pilus assembly protein PilC
MPKFSYIALDATGQEQKGTIDATNQTDAISNIREKGLFPTDIDEVGAAGPKARSGAFTGKKAKKGGAKGLSMEIRMPAIGGVKQKVLMAFTRQLATLIDAGLPLVRGLRVLQKQEKNVVLRDAIEAMADSIESGTTFAESLAQHPRIFNRLFVNMVKAGEVGGILDIVLRRLAEFMEKAQKIKNKVTSAMIYPMVVMVMAIAILSFLLIFIIPKFEEIFSDMLGDEQLPGLTRFVINTSRGLVDYWYAVIGVIVGIVVGVYAFGRTKKGRYAIDWIKFKIPLFGSLLLRTAIARFSRTLGTLMNSGVPVLQALNIVRDTAGNEVVATSVNKVHDAVKEGENMSPPIEASGIFPPVVVSMVEVGEETGALPDMLERIADNYEDEVDNAVAGITSVIEPILIVFLAVIVGTIVIALFLPLIAIIGNLSNA